MTALWEEPVQGELFPAEWLGLSGIEQLRLLLSGRVGGPPVGCLTGMHLTEHGIGSATFAIGARPTAAGEGTCEFTMPATGSLAPPTGFVEGGLTAFLADTVLGGAIQTTVPAGTAIAPTDL